MSQRDWDPLDLRNVFWPAKTVHMQDRVADLYTRDTAGKAVPLEGWDLIKDPQTTLGV